MLDLFFSWISTYFVAGVQLILVSRCSIHFLVGDQFNFDPKDILPAQPRQKDGFDDEINAAMQKLSPAYTRSTTVVMETAFFLIQQGLLNIPDTKSTNVKQRQECQ